MIAQERVVTRQACYEQKVKTTEVVIQKSVGRLTECLLSQVFWAVSNIEISWAPCSIPAEAGVQGGVQQ